MGALGCLASCATADRYTDKPMIQRDAHTRYAVDETETGFVLYVLYERYSSFPNRQQWTRLQPVRCSLWRTRSLRGGAGGSVP